MGISAIGSMSDIQMMQTAISKLGTSSNQAISFGMEPVDKNETYSVLTLQGVSGEKVHFSKAQATRLFELLSRADTDKDGIVTPEEMKTLMEQLKSELERLKKMESDMKVIKIIQAYKSEMQDENLTGKVSNDIKLLNKLQECNTEGSNISADDGKKGISIAKLGQVLSDAAAGKS